MKKLLVLLASIAFLSLGTMARAEFLDPSDIHVNDGTAYLFNNEVHDLTNPSTVSLAGNPHATIDPLFLVFAVPGDSDSLSTTVNGITGVYKGDLTSGQDVYNDVLNLSAFHPDGSMSFVNFTLNADQSATNFDIWTFDLNTSLTNASPVIVNFLNGPPSGTYVFAYGFDGDTLYVTPFTESALQDHHQVPEPGMLMLFGSGLVGLAFFGRKKFRK